MAGQHIEHQARRARTFRRKPHSRQRPFRTVHYARSGVFITLYSNLRCIDCDHQYETAAGRRFGLGPTDQPVPASLQAE